MVGQVVIPLHLHTCHLCLPPMPTSSSCFIAHPFVLLEHITNFIEVIFQF